MSCQVLANESAGHSISARLYWRKRLAASANPASVKLVGHTIADHFYADGTGAHPSLAMIATGASLSERTVNRAVKTLVENGWLTVRSGGGRRRGKQRGTSFRGMANEYTAALHKGCNCATDDRTQHEYTATGAGNYDTEDGNSATDDTDTPAPVAHQVVGLEVSLESGSPLLVAPRSENGDALVEDENQEEGEDSVIEHLDEYFDPDPNQERVEEEHETKTHRPGPPPKPTPEELERRRQDQLAALRSFPEVAAAKGGGG